MLARVWSTTVLLRVLISYAFCLNFTIICALSLLSSLFINAALQKLLNHTHPFRNKLKLLWKMVRLSICKFIHCEFLLRFSEFFYSRKQKKPKQTESVVVTRRFADKKRYLYQKYLLLVFYAHVSDVRWRAYHTNESQKLGIICFDGTLLLCRSEFFWFQSIEHISWLYLYTFMQTEMIFMLLHCTLASNFRKWQSQKSKPEFTKWFYSNGLANFMDLRIHIYISLGV